MLALLECLSLQVMGWARLPVKNVFNEEYIPLISFFDRRISFGNGDFDRFQKPSQDMFLLICSAIAQFISNQKLITY
jgi:hypothetical protein